MSDMNIRDISGADYEAVLRTITELSEERFHFLNIVEDIANHILMRLFKFASSAKPDFKAQEFVETIFPRAVEDTFQNYQKAAFAYCFSKTKEPELSEDISQEAIMEMLLSRNNINNISAWLFQVTHNLLCAYYERLSQEQRVYELLRRDSAILQELSKQEDNFDITYLNDADKKMIIASEEYKKYEELLSFESLTDFAQSLDISEKTAQKRKEKIIRDLKSKTMLAMGWEVSQDILNYNQYHAIQRFIRELLSLENIEKYVKSNEELSRKVSDTMQGIEQVHDWGIVMLKNDRFMLHIFSLKGGKTPTNISFNIILNDRNSIVLESCKETELVATHKMPENLRIPIHLGESLWSYAKVVSILEQ
jgi:DNA-directed RNA polymerase specialized sigma24 family protein